MKRFGQVLVQRGLITQDILAQALVQQQKNGCRLGDILVSEGALSYMALYQALAEYYELPFVDLLKYPAEPSLLLGKDLDSYLRLRVMPWRNIGNTICYAVCEVDQNVLSWIQKRSGDRYALTVTSPVDIRRTVEQRFGKAMAHESHVALWRRHPNNSARITMPARQKRVFYLLAFAACLAITWLPVESALAIIAVCHAIYLATMLFKTWIFCTGARQRRRINWQKTLQSLDERTLPVYTVLIPMYREAASLPGLLRAMQSLDYPAAKLDIKLVLEADDEDTLSAARALKPRYQFEIIAVPPSEPRTKPKACNYALYFARGTYLTIFDADDRPDPLQLKKAVYSFRRAPHDVICLQARLNYYNTQDGLLTRFFSLEYAMLFNHLLYGLQRLNIPIPLGGTSNHIALDRLRAIGEWDPYNVTEDADLGTRLAGKGYKTHMLDSDTFEEAPNRICPWIKQRSRWIKGYMQTWLVHMRSPLALYRTLGWRGFIGFQFFVGFSCFTFLSAPLVWALSLIWIAASGTLLQMEFPNWLAWLTASNMVLNIVTHWYFSLFCAFLYKKHRGFMVWAALLYPAYLILHSLASYKALWQLIVKPHFWEKTEHGRAKHAFAMQLKDAMREMEQKPLTAQALMR